jgi:hypothetical protein
MLTKTKTTRITLDLPVDLYTQIKSSANQKGETLKRFFIDLATNPKTSTLNLHQTLVKKRNRPKALNLGINQTDLQLEINDLWTPRF